MCYRVGIVVVVILSMTTTHLLRKQIMQSCTVVITVGLTRVIVRELFEKGSFRSINAMKFPRQAVFECLVSRPLFKKIHVIFLRR